MFWIILGSFVCLLLFVLIASNPENNLIKNKKTKEHLLDILTSFMGGFLFVIAMYLFESSHPERFFRLDLQFFDARDWRFGKNNLGPFIFGFIFTYIIIFIRSQYKKL